MSKKLTSVLLALFLTAYSGAASASPWNEEPGNYFQKTGRKLKFGLQHTLLSWTVPWLESTDTKYSRPWKGFCIGIGKAVVYTAGGLVHLASFPIPVDFPDFEGIRIPNRKEPVKQPSFESAIAPAEPSQETWDQGVTGESKEPPSVHLAGQTMGRPAPQAGTGAARSPVPPAAGEADKDAAMRAALEEAGEDNPAPGFSEGTDDLPQSPFDK